MSNKVYDIVAKTGEYTDNQGQQKANWKNVGAVMKGDKGSFIMLDRSFNPAGLPNPDNRSNVLLSLFAPNQNQGQQQQPAPQQQSAPPQQPDNFDDDIPF